MDKVYDVIIIGAGPAGLSAGTYAGRARLSTLIIEKEKDGGQIVLTSEVENYPGCIEGESGPTLVDRMADQAKHFGAEKVYDEILEVKLEGKEKVLVGKKGEYIGKTVIIAGGASLAPNLWSLPASATQALSRPPNLSIPSIKAPRVSKKFIFFSGDADGSR